MTATPRPDQQHTQPASLPATRRIVAQLRRQDFSPVPLRNWGDLKNRKAPREEHGWQHRIYTEQDWQPGEGIGTRTGKQQNGLYFYIVDADSHSNNQDAPRYLHEVEGRISPELNAKLAKAVSTGGNGRYLAFYSRRLIPNGTIHNQQGYKAGEFLGEGRQVVYIEPTRWLHRSYTTIIELDDYDVDELLTALNYTPTRSKGAPHHTVHTSTTCTDPTAQHWYEHAHELEDDTSVPKAIGQGISRRLLTRATPITNESDARYIVMLQMYRVGYTDAQILGYAMHRCDWNRSGWKLRDDCERILAKLKIELPDRHICEAARRRDESLNAHTSEESRGDNNSAYTPEPRRRGRPMAHPEQQLLSYLTQDGEHGIFDDTNEMLATALYCDVRTIKRHLKALEQHGEIERRYVAGRRLIVLTPDKKGDTNCLPAVVHECQNERTTAHESSAAPGKEETRVSSPPPAEAAAPDGSADTFPAGCTPVGPYQAVWHGPDTDESVTVVGIWDKPWSDGKLWCLFGGNSSTSRPMDELEIQGQVGVPAQLAPARRPSLVRAVREAMDAYGARVKRIQRYIDDNFGGHGWTVVDIKRAYQRELSCRKRQRLIDRIANMRAKELSRAIRSAERHIAKSHKREDNSWKFWIVYQNRCGRRLKQLHAEDNRQRRDAVAQLSMLLATTSTAGASPAPVAQRPHPGCLIWLHCLLTDPGGIVEVERYMRRYPNFDYADVPMRIAQLRRQEAAQ